MAVYFMRKGKAMVFACDKFDKSEDNIYAIGKTLEAMRGIERWGASDMMERAFTGFKQLGGGTAWHEILAVPQSATREQIEAAFRSKARTAHPDAGGSHDAMAALTAARTEGLKVQM